MIYALDQCQILVENIIEDAFESDWMTQLIPDNLAAEQQAVIRRVLIVCSETAEQRSTIHS